MIYLLDTNAVADYIYGVRPVMQHMERAIEAEDQVCLCEPVHYEVMRGLLWKGAAAKQQRYEQQFAPMLKWVPVVHDDWQQAAQFWADMRRKGRQISDVDVLIAALAVRLNAVIISADTDFDALPVQRESWR